MPPPYRVVYSKAIVAKIKELHATAKELGMEETFMASLRAIDSRLTNDPTEFGDPVFTLHSADLRIRYQIVKPLVVYWGVNDKNSLVFLKSLELWPADA
jgi:hypothetical protein